MDDVIRPPRRAPDFVLADSDGREVSLTDLLGDGPVVLIFYRGEWCPFCNEQLGAYAERYGEFQRLGAQVVAISVDGRPAGKALRTRLRLPFTVVCDPDHTLVDQFAGVGEKLREGKPVARPATFVLDRHGTIQWAHVGTAPADRPSVDDVLAQVESTEKRAVN